MENESPEENESDGEPETTVNTRIRWKFAGTIFAGIILLSLPFIIVGTAGGLLTLSSIGQTWATLYAIVTLMAATWAFGEGTLNAVRRTFGKNE